MATYKWVWRDSARTEKLFKVGIWGNGTLFNPNGYPEDVVRAAVLAVEARRAERRRQSAKKGVATRARRRASQVNSVVKRIAEGKQVGPRYTCACCSRKLTDPVAIGRGVGPECWDTVVGLVERLVGKDTLLRLAGQTDTPKIRITIAGMPLFAGVLGSAEDDLPYPAHEKEQ